MTFYITTPLFYVNDLPHIGSAYPTIVCDFIVGHMRQRGVDTAFLTGTDEHGQKIEKAARANNKSPKQHCNEVTEEFKKLWSLLEIDYDYFVRTSELKHYEFVREFYNKVEASGDIYKGQYSGLYCVSCEDFWLEKDLEKNDSDEFICPTHKKQVEEYSQENYFFRLSKYEGKLKKLLDDNPDFVSPDYRRNEVLGWIKEGLRDFPISRTNLSWGIPVPGDDNGQVIYVWFDALLGYISGLAEDQEKFWQNDQGSKTINVIGKDILRFHAVYWPAMLMSAGYPVPSRVFGHGFLTKDGMKMGKTLGNIIDPVALCQNYGAEAVKFYFLREIVFGRDGDFSDEGFVQRLNSDLANNLGNLLNRSLKLINKYFDGKLPDCEINAGIRSALKNLYQSFYQNLDELNPYFAFEELFKMLDQVNVLINDAEPWKALKNSEPGSEAYQKGKQALVTAAYACLHAAYYLAPAMPRLASRILINLGCVSDEVLSLERKDLLQKVFALSDLQDYVFTKSVLNEPQPIFARIELQKEAQV